MTRLPIFFSFLGVLAIAAFNGCGDDSKPQADPDKYPGIEQFCNAIAEVQCTKDVTENCALSSIADCVGVVQNDCRGSRSALTSNFNTEKYNPKKAEPCIDKIKATFADAVLEVAELRAIEDSCAPTFSLNAGQGFQCQRNADCADTAKQKCFFTAPGVGTCEVAVAVGGGQDCSGAGSLCPDDQFCFSNPEVGTICKAKQKTGQKCIEVTQPCDPANFCQGGKDESGNDVALCNSKYGGGAVCQTDDQCVDGLCLTIFTKDAPKGRGICSRKIIFSSGETYCDNFRPK